STPAAFSLPLRSPPCAAVRSFRCRSRRLRSLASHPGAAVRPKAVAPASRQATSPPASPDPPATSRAAPRRGRRGCLVADSSEPFLALARPQMRRNLRRLRGKVWFFQGIPRGVRFPYTPVALVFSGFCFVFRVLLAVRCRGLSPRHLGGPGEI